MKQTKEQAAFRDDVKLALDVLEETEKEHLIDAADSYQQKVVKEYVLGVLRRYGEKVEAEAEAAEQAYAEAEEQPKPARKTAKAK